MVDCMREAHSFCSPLRQKYRTSKFPNLRKKYRSDFEIIALLLEAMKDNDAARYSLMKYTSTNYAQLKKYLECLIEMGFIETDIREGQVLYRASEKGVVFLRQYYILLGMLFNAYTRNKQVNIDYQAEYASFNRPQNSEKHFATPFTR